jgi:RHS repeat-associated protein
VIKPATTPSADVIAWKWDYFGNSFGEDYPNEDPTSSGTPLTFNLRFPGQYYDAETGMHYNYRRNYQPGIGRYIEADPIGLRGGGDLYAYAGSVPVTFVDEAGLLHTTPPSGNIEDGSVYCEDGEIKWYVSISKCPAIDYCLAIHEKTHVADFLRNDPTICQRSKSWFEVWKIVREVRYDSVSEMQQYEYHAYSEELYCLAYWLNFSCTSCDYLIRQRMDDIQNVLIPEVVAGTYHSRR